MIRKKVVETLALKTVVIGAIVVLVMASLGAFLLLNSMTPQEKEQVLLNDVFAVAGHSYQNKTAWVTSSGEYIASLTVLGGTINFSWVPMVELWLEGKYTPDWQESDQLEYGFGASLGEEGIRSPFSFVFQNNDTATRQVHLQVSKVWEETDYVSRLGGAVLVLAGIMVAVVLVYRRR